MAFMLGRTLLALRRAVQFRVIPAVAYELGRLRSPRQAVYQWPEGEIPVGPRVCVFVHWDGTGEVREHVLHYVLSLADAGLSVLFVTNSGRLQPDSLARLKTMCAGVLIRRNVGYDFGAWREGFEALNLPREDTELAIMANDSVYGPLRPLHDVLAAINLDEADVWGCTETWQSRYHLQSYLLGFSPRVLASPVWRRFWASVRPAPSKHAVIHRYEVGLSQSLIKAGFRCRAIWPYDRLAADIETDLPQARTRADEEDYFDPKMDVRRAHARRLHNSVVYRVPLNPTSDLWRQLLRAGFPFLKRELLRDNPSDVLDIIDWREVAAEAMQPDVSAIERDLQRTLKNKAP